MNADKIKIISFNRKAKRDYDILETYEAGIVLKGDEVKSLRNRSCSIEESFARVERGEVFLYNAHIPEFEKSSYFRSDPKRTRKLLLHKQEISRLIGFIAQKGFTLIPLKVYFTPRGIVKVELGAAKGRRLYDKRQKIKKEIIDKEITREMKRLSRR